MTTKPKVAFYWAASCGGCDITITELGIHLVELGEKVDIVFWPCAMDFKYNDIHSMKDGSIDICFFNGAIRSDENQRIAELLRKKTKVLVAFGACAHMGGIPSLANLYDKESLLKYIYEDSPSLDGTKGKRPLEITEVPEGEILLPVLFDAVKTLSQTVKVDYSMPGCPPVADQVWKVMRIILEGKLPKKEKMIGVDEKSNCHSCQRYKGESFFRITEFKRPHEVELDPEKCFLTQGVVCYGPVTRNGCGLPCVNANFPCRGCYGPPEGVVDQGSKLISAIIALIETEKPEELQNIMNSFIDPMGTCYRFGVAESLINQMKYQQEVKK